jgi:glycosyltransferase involved in cell wall biosynthesis
MLNVLVVHQPANPQSGGGHTLQGALIQELKNQAAYRTDFRIQLCSADIVPRIGIQQIKQHAKPDLVWYLFPTKNFFQLPCISTIWDLGHRDYPIFPELSTEGWTFRQREETYSSMVESLRVLVGNNYTKERCISFYGITSDHLVVNPLPSVPIRQNPKTQKPNREAGKLQLLYPAQFWAHKNHVLLIEAAEIFRSLGGEPVLFHLTGSDKGNLEHIQNLISERLLSESFQIHGFVEEDELENLYSTCDGLVYPSLLGPDNLPPLEAMIRDLPSVIADLPGSREVFGNHAIYFYPFDAQSLVSALRRLRDHEFIRELQSHAKIFAETRSAATYVNNVFSELEQIRGQIRLFRR